MMGGGGDEGNEKGRVTVSVKGGGDSERWL